VHSMSGIPPTPPTVCRRPDGLASRQVPGEEPVPVVALERRDAGFLGPAQARPVRGAVGVVLELTRLH